MASSQDYSIRARRWIGMAAALGAWGVAMGAFGAHALRAWLPLQKMTIFETGVRYHLVHVLALMAVGILMELLPRSAPALGRVAPLFLAGLLLFSGGLYGASLTDVTAFMWVVPLGGLAWIAAWGALAWVVWRGPGRG